MSKLGYMSPSEPEGELHDCCETADWAADEIERLHAALRHVVRIYMVSEVAPDPSAEVERMVQWLLSNTSTLTHKWGAWSSGLPNAQSKPPAGMQS